MELSTIISVLSMSVALAAFIFNIFTNYKSSIREKKQSTLDAYNILQTQALDKLNSFSTDEIKKIINDKHSEKYEEISKFLARVEHFCVGVEEEIYDFETLYKLAHGYFDETVYKKLLSLIDRKDENKNFDAYANFKKVVQRMKNF